MTAFLFIVAFLAFLNPGQPAQAYLDPGTGSILLQMLLGIFAGAAVVGRLYWDRLKSFFRRDPVSSESKSPPPDS